MSLHDRVAEQGERLTASDRRLLEILLSHPQEASYLPANEVAHRAGVHQASATKFAQRLGYDGYPDLRRDLQRDLLTTSSERITRTVEHAGPGSLLELVVEQEMQPLADLPRQVTQDQLDRIASLLLHARVRYAFGRGNATVLADLLIRRMRRYGLPMTQLEASGRDLAEQLVGVGAGDVVVLYAFRRVPRYFPQVLEHCSTAGATTVVVTDTLAAEASTATLVLTGSRGTAREFQSLTVPMAVTNALVLTLARLAPRQTRDALGRLDDLLDRFDR